MRAVLWCLAAVSLGLIGYSVFEEWDRERPLRARVVARHIELENAIVGTPNPVSFVVVNDGTEPFGIIGADSNCINNCCVFSRLPAPVTLAPGDQTYIFYEVHPKGVGERFDGESTIFVLSRGRVERLRVTVSGIGRSAP